MEADQDRDGKISFEEFTKMVENTDVSMSMTLGMPSESPIACSISNAFTWSRCDKIFLILTVRQINSSKYPFAKQWHWHLAWQSNLRKMSSASFSHFKDLGSKYKNGLLDFFTRDVEVSLRFPL